MHNRVDLSTYSPKGFARGASAIAEALWLVVRSALFLHIPFGLYGFKRWTLRRFGAHVGKGVVIKPGVKITFPWKLRIGDHAWLGEDCWILNLDDVFIGDHVCISQRAMICAGSHDYKSPSFDLITSPIRLEAGAWIAANCWVGPGVTIGAHAVLGAGSVTSKDLEPYGIYQGNPAVKVKTRTIG
ncbi:MAG TPA: putative colanic acid biosynthesis acetyltransferase [Candidatus Hydrogenedentes bacterium]|nr:putative colanic acid biosynthesis acetyltransferase [Candidatus Hydrogenedentota bacterium]HOS01730.1 putative colanic acid biosynthesis acetyltransferase [Candidatus Hydrogenedentota bacterium]